MFRLQADVTSCAVSLEYWDVSRSRIKITASLRRLEYRGYDSGGLATLESGRLTHRRAQGKLKQLEGRFSGEPLSGTIGIGHARWATHDVRARSMRIPMPPMPLRSGALASRGRPCIGVSLSGGAAASRDLAVLVSQSGETADTLASPHDAGDQGQHILSVVNVESPTIACASDVVMPTLAGPEIGARRPSRLLASWRRSHASCRER